MTSLWHFYHLYTWLEMDLYLPIHARTWVYTGTLTGIVHLIISHVTVPFTDTGPDTDKSKRYSSYFMSLLGRNIRQNNKIFSRKVHAVNGEYFVLWAILYHPILSNSLTWLSNLCLPVCIWSNLCIKYWRIVYTIVYTTF